VELETKARSYQKMHKDAKRSLADFARQL